MWLKVCLSNGTDHHVLDVSDLRHLLQDGVCHVSRSLATQNIYPRHSRSRIGKLEAVKMRADGKRDFENRCALYGDVGGMIFLFGFCASLQSRTI